MPNVRAAMAARTNIFITISFVTTTLEVRGPGGVSYAPTLDFRVAYTR